MICTLSTGGIFWSACSALRESVNILIFSRAIGLVKLCSSAVSMPFNSAAMELLLLVILTCTIAPSLIFYFSILSIRFGAHKPYRFHAPFVIHWLNTLAYVMSDCCLLWFTCNFAYSVCLTLCICMTIKLFWIWNLFEFEFEFDFGLYSEWGQSAN